MPIQKLKTIREQVYNILKNEICTGKIKPGEWLQEKEISNRLNVSRSPIREALRLLVGDGLALEIPNKGVFVKEFCENDIKEIFEIRVLLESYALRKFGENFTKEQTDELNNIIKKLEIEFNNNDIELYTKYDKDLHYQIIKLGGNSLIETTYRQIKTMISPFRSYALYGKERFIESLAEHKKLVNYIISNDIDNAILINNKHLKHAMQSIIDYLNNSKNK